MSEPPLLPYQPKPRPQRLSKLGQVEYLIIAFLFGLPGMVLIVIGAIGIFLQFSLASRAAGDPASCRAAILLGIAMLVVSGVAIAQVLRARWRSKADSDDTPPTDANPRH